MTLTQVWWFGSIKVIQYAVLQARLKTSSSDWRNPMESPSWTHRLFDRVATAICSRMDPRINAPPPGARTLLSAYVSKKYYTTGWIVTLCGAETNNINVPNSNLLSNRSISAFFTLLLYTVVELRKKWIINSVLFSRDFKNSTSFK